LRVAGDPFGEALAIVAADPAAHVADAGEPALVGIARTLLDKARSGDGQAMARVVRLLGQG